jgi:alkylation response protein AidB-like acyl-CoA dehydrogenase
MMHSIERGLSEEQKMMRETCRAFVNDFVTPFIRQNWQREWVMKPEDRLPASILEQAHKIGIRTLAIPEEFGGTPLDPAEEVQTFAVISEELARGDSGLADKLVQIWKVSVLLRNVAPRHLQEYWFPRIAEDPSFLLAHCLTEPRGASDRWLPYDVPEAMMHTRAELKGDKWVINGRKQFISNGYDAKLYVVYATTKPGAGMTKGTSSFLVPRDTPGLVVQRCNETMGGRFMNNGELVFEDMAVPADHLLQGRRLFQAGQNHPGVQESRRRHGRFRENRRVRADLHPGRTHPHQAPGGRVPSRRDGDEARGGARDPS